MATPSNRTAEERAAYRAAHPRWTAAQRREARQAREAALVPPPPPPVSRWHLVLAWLITHT